jgi:GAF domain-containing protein
MAQSIKQPHTYQSQDDVQSDIQEFSGDASRKDGDRFVVDNNREVGDDILVSLHEVTRALARAKSLSFVLQVIVDKSKQLTRGSSTALCLLDDDAVNLHFVAVAGRGASEMVGQTVRASDALPGHTALTGEQLLAYNPDFDRPQEQKTRAAKGRYGLNESEETPVGGIRSAAIVPIYGESSPIGSLGSIDKLDGESFTGRDLLVLHVLSSLASVAIRQERSSRERSSAQRERDVLQEAALTSSSTLNLQRILDGVLTTAERSVDMFAGMVFQLNDEHTHLYIAADRGLTDDEKEIQLFPDGKMAGAALVSGNAFIISSPENDPRYEQIFPSDRPQPLSWMVAPLISRDTHHGIVVICSLSRDAYTIEDLRLLKSIAAPAAVAMENAELYEQATRRSDEATAIYELSQALNTNLNLSHVLSFVADSIVSLLHVDKFALYLHDPKTNSLEIKVSRNIRKQTVHQMRPTREAGGIAWWVFEYETPAAVLDVSRDNRNKSCPIDQENVSSLVSVPIRAGDDVIGVIHAMSSRSRSFTVAEMELLYTIANQVGVAISNIQIINETRQKSEELRRSAKRVARALGVSGNLMQASQMVVDLAAEMMHTDKCVLYTRSGADLVFRAAHGIKASEPTSVEPDSLPYLVLKKGRSIVIEDLSLSASSVSPTFVALAGKVTSYLGLPLKIGSGIVGVLELYSKDARSFKLDEIRQYSALAAQAAMAVQNAMLLEQAGRREDDLNLFIDLSSGLASESGDDTIRQAVQSVKTALGCSGVAICQVNNLENAVSLGDISIADDAAMRRLFGELIAAGAESVKLPSDLVKEGDHYERATYLFAEKNGLFVLKSGLAILATRSGDMRSFDEGDVKVVKAVLNLVAKR